MTEKQSQQAFSELCAHPFASALDHLEGVVCRECDGDFPVARINWLEIYLTSSEILGSYAKAIRKDEPPLPCCEPDTEEKWTAKGRYYVERLLLRADTSELDGSIVFVSAYRRAIGDARNAIHGALKGEFLLCIVQKIERTNATKVKQRPITYGASKNAA